MLLYALLCGFLPFDDDNTFKLYKLIQVCKRHRNYSSNYVIIYYDLCTYHVVLIIYLFSVLIFFFLQKGEYEVPDWLSPGK